MGLSAIEDGTLVTNNVLKVIPLICQNCGFVRLHSTDILLSDS